MPMETSIQVRVSFEQKARIEERAKAAAMRPATFMRDLALYGGMDVEGIPYETPQETLNKAKVRQAVENEEPYEVKVEPGAIISEKDQGIEREPWIDSTARTLMMEKGLSKVAATMQAAKEWEAANG